jgi:N-acetylglucosamine malate deacetylase 1
MKVLVVAAHPDDEVLGCGGTIAKHVQAGDEVHVLIMSIGVDSRDMAVEEIRAESESRKASAQQASKILGTDIMLIYEFPDNKMDTIPHLSIVKLIEIFIQQLSPELVYTHHAGDMNVDHRITHQAVMTACRPLPGCSVKTILCFEVPSSTEWGTGFEPNWFVDVTRVWKKKQDALVAYESEMREFPHPRSYEGVRHLAQWRGATVGVHAAEAFMVARRIC